MTSLFELSSCGACALYSSFSHSQLAQNDISSSSHTLSRPIVSSNKHSMAVRCQALQQWSRGDAPGEYGGPPVDPRIRTSWGTNKPDPITSGESYIWNTDWKKALELEEREAEELAAGQKDKSKGADDDSGFLSIGRSLALDSMEVDLSAELSKPSKATLERQVAVARQAIYDKKELQEREKEKEAIRWRAVPTRGEERLWAKSNKFTTGGTEKLLEDVQRDISVKDPKKVREAEILRFEQLKRDLQLYTVGIGAGCLACTYFTYDSEIALSYGAGLVGSFMYIRMLSSSVESIGADSMGQAAKGALGQPRLLVPVILVLFFNRWNAILVPKYDLLPLELIPMLVGFFTYKAATLVQTFQEILAPFVPKEES